MPGPNTFPIPGLTFHYVPREICIRVQSKGPPDPDTAMAVNGRLPGLLNPQLRANLTNVMQVGGNGLNQDLAPSPLLWPRCDVSGAGPLGELSRWPPERRFVQFGYDGATTDTLHFFAVEVNPTDPGFTDEDRAGTIRDLVKLINTQFQSFAPPTADNEPPPWSVTSATPNWLTSPSGYTDGGNPGTPPDPVTAPSASETFHFGHSELEAIVQRERERAHDPNDRANVVVAVLDTSPSLADVHKAQANPLLDNRLMDAVANPQTGVGIDEPLMAGINAFQQADFAHLSNFVPNWGQLLNKWQSTGAAYRPHLRATYATPDHGLFIAGIIKDIAPRAEVHLIRVLDDAGVGDLLALTLALSLVPRMLIEREDVARRLIVNLSLSIDVPSPADLRALWFPQAIMDAAPPVGQEATIQAHLDAIQSSFTGVLDWLLVQGHLIVASVGNDGLGQQVPPPARMPARHPGVLSVAALNRLGKPSAFSNAATATGVAVYGGDADVNAGTGEIEIMVNPATGIPDAPVGIFQSAALPFNAGPNTNGWAYWAGTSFAAPIVSAIAADLCAQGAISNAQVISDIQSLATISATPFGPAMGGILAFQV